jgi:hypothetical protein
MAGVATIGSTNLVMLSPYNGYLPQATNQVIEYIRKPSEFALNRYAQYVEAPAPVFTWPYVDPDQPVRIVSDAEWAWEDGHNRPSGNANLLSYKWIPGRAFRRSYPWRLGDQAIEFTKKFSNLDPKVEQAGQVASQAMTNRTNRVVNLLENSANWSGNVNTATGLNGGAGKWSGASDDPTNAAYLAIKKSLLGAALIITLGTNARVRIKDMKLILSPQAAATMSETGEIYNYIKYGVSGGLAPQEGTDRDMSELWGLPPKLYGFEIDIEDSPIVTTYPSQPYTPASIVTGTGGRNWVKVNTTAFLVSRIGGIDGAYGAPSFSTVQVYFVGAQMALFEFHDTKNQNTEGYVDEQFLEVLAAPASGYLIQSII